MSSPTFLDLAASIDNQLRRNIRFPTLPLVAGVTALTNLSRMVTGDASGGVITAQLPDAVVNDGMYFEFKKIDGSANALTVQGTGGQLIDAAPTFSLTLIQQALGIVASGGNWKILYSPSTSAVVGTGGSTLLADGAFQTGGDFNPPALTVVPGTTKIINVSGSGNTHIAGSGTSSGSDSLPSITFGIRVDGVDYLTTAAEQQGAGADKVFNMVLNRSVLLPLAPGPHTISLVYAAAGQRDALLGTGDYISALSILYPVAIGGGPVVGGSGAIYATIALAIAGETETRVAAVVPQAGTGPALIVGPGTLSAVNDFYKDWIVVNTDTTPTSGLACQWARVSSYDGATRGLTLDKPWDFSAESDFLLVDPVRLTLKQDITEDVTVNKCAIMDLGGNRVKGKVDVTASEFCWIRGANGYITNGVQKSDFGMLKIDKCVVSRRDATIYALLMTNGSDLGRCELDWCEFMGRVAGRRGFSGWSIFYCRSVGIPSSSNYDNLAYTLVESIAGVAVVVSQMDAQLDGDFGGAIFYSENSITGATASVSIQGNINLAWTYAAAIYTAPNPQVFSFARAEGAATLTLTVTAGAARLTISQFNSGASTGQVYLLYVLSVKDFTGTISVNVGITYIMTNLGNMRAVEVEGTADCTGSITLAGSVNVSGVPSLSNSRLLGLQVKLNGATVVISAAVTIMGTTYAIFEQRATQNAGVPSVTISGSQTLHIGTEFSGYSSTGAVPISVGTWTVSGIIEGIVTCNTFFSPGTDMAGGTFTISSATIRLNIVNKGRGQFVFLSGTPTSGTLSCSSATTIVLDRVITTFNIVQNVGSGGTVSMTGAISFFNASIAPNTTLCQATAAGTTAQLSGAVAFFACRFEGNITSICNAGNATATITAGPTSVTFEHCSVIGSFTVTLATGTVTWAASSLLMRLCYVGGLFTILGTNFTTIEFFHSRFNGNASNKALTLTGTRPTTLRYWKCSFAARFDDLQPEVLDVYDILPAQAALVQGQPVKVNAANQYQVCVAASIVDGVALAAAGGAGTILIALRQGRTYVTCKAGTVNGDNLVLDLATPTQANQGAFLAGQEIGTALENVGAVVAGKCYTAVNVR